MKPWARVRVGGKDGTDIVLRPEL